MAQLLTFPCPFDALSFRSSNCVRFVTQVVGVLEEEVPDLIEVPKPLEHASVVGDHINFHLINPTPEENVAFQVKVMRREKLFVPPGFSSCRETFEAWRAIYPDGWNVAAM